MNLSTLDTPALILEERRFTRNVERVHTAIRRHPGVTLRPHFKTAKSIAALERIFLANRQATVSTISEAEHLCRHGVRDLLYAVGISAPKLVMGMKAIDGNVLRPTNPLGATPITV